MKLKHSEIYVKAAKRIDSGKDWYSCNAVSFIETGHGFSYTEARSNYSALMGLGSSAAYPNTRTLWDMDHAEQAELRVWLLCMAAAIAEEEENEKV